MERFIASMSPNISSIFLGCFLQYSQPLKIAFSSTMASASASALLNFGISPRFYSSSFQPCPKASMQNTSPTKPNVNLTKVLKLQSHKWTFPVNHSFTPTNSIPDVKMGIEYGFEMKTLKHLLSEIAKVDHLESLNMIDAIQRLGIEHCFKEEVEAILQTQYTMATQYYVDNISGLHEVALRFRLLRQHGFFVSTDVFESFMDKEGQLDKELNENIQGLMSLYEASQLCFPDEHKLERIGNFSRHMLQTSIGNLDDHLANHVVNALASPFHKTSAKLWANNYFGLQPTCNKWIYVFQQMSKLDFSTLQNLYRQEISQLSMWWRKTELSDELTFARDQPLKWHICSLAFLADPKFSDERVDLTKSISFIYLIDDIYDLYGSLEELRLFTKAIQRWDLAAIDNLSHPMKICYIKLYETTNEISHKVYRKHGWNPIESLKKSWVSLCDAFLIEAEWFGSGHSPSAKEYLENGVVSSGVHVVLVHIFFLLGQEINSKTVQLINSNPGIVTSTASILRLSDDLGSAKDENQEGYDGSYIEYYMKENPETSLDKTRQRVIHMISEAWKTLNQQSLSPNPFPPAFIQASLNIARFVPLLYGYDDNQNLPTLEKLVDSLLHETLQF